MLAGLAGTIEVVALNYRHTLSFNIGYGFDAIAIALLAKSNPLGVVLAAILFGAMRNGATRMQFFTQVPGRHHLRDPGPGAALRRRRRDNSLHLPHSRLRRADSVDAGMGALRCRSTASSFILLTIAVLIGITVAFGSGQNSADVIAAQLPRHDAAGGHAAHPGRALRPVLRARGRGQHRHRGHDAGRGLLRLAGRHLRGPAAGLPALAALLVGVGAAIVSGLLFALLHAVLSITFKVDQIISGTVINILAVGLTGFLNRALFFQREVPHAPGVLPTIHIPLLSDLPVVGRVFEQQPIALAAIVLVILTHWVLFSTRWGLRTRAVGENPLAADTVGINVFRMRYVNVLIGGAVAGLAGAYFTLESVPSFEPGQTAGRGFIALAAMIFGNWTPFGAWAAALLFGAAQALQINAQYFGLPVPSQLVGALPYIADHDRLDGRGRGDRPARRRRQAVREIGAGVIRRARSSSKREA